jgi:hypothetical protein
MVLLEESGSIVVLPTGGEWTMHEDSWDADDPEGCEAASASEYEIMGFGDLWCNNELIQRSLGAPTDDQQPSESLQGQNFDNGGIFELSDGTIIVLFNDGMWKALY